MNNKPNKKQTVLIFGGKGRMGTELVKTSSELHKNLEILTIDKDNVADIRNILDKIDIVIDFSSPEGFEILIKNLLENPKPLISGTTGLQDKHFILLKQLSQKTAVLYASNFSLGINLLLYLTKLCSTALDDSFNPEILEIHHKNKKDAPSGTALSLAKTILKAKNYKENQVITGSRYSDKIERASDTIGIQSLRGGDVVGEHTVMFLGNGERIELTHKASERATFARGAWKAAMWLLLKPSGLYQMNEVLNLPSL